MVKLVQGLKRFAEQEEAERIRREQNSNYEKATWVKLKDGDRVRIRFLQELEEDSPNYSEKNGIGGIAHEHVNPDNYLAKAVCTIDEGQCFGCEQYAARVTGTGKNEKKTWRVNKRLYVNVLVNDGKNDPYVAVLSQGTSGKSITPTLQEYLNDNDSITNIWWTLKRTGVEVQDVSYTLLPSNPVKDDEKTPEEFEIFNLDKVLRTLPYSEQEAFYYRDSAAKREVEVTTPKNVKNDDIW